MGDDDKSKRKKHGKRAKVIVEVLKDGEVSPSGTVEEEVCCDIEEDNLGEHVQRILSTHLPGRGNVVMTRLSDEDLEILDALVTLEVFSSRSEGVAYFTHVGMEQKKDMVERVMPYLEKIRRLKEEARSTLH